MFNSEDSSDRRKTLRKSDVYRIYGGDSKVLELSLHVMTKLGQSSFTLTQQSPIASHLYDEALQLIVLTWNRG
jgi:hypothetical protein